MRVEMQGGDIFTQAEKWFDDPETKCICGEILIRGIYTPAFEVPKPYFAHCFGIKCGLSEIRGDTKQDVFLRYLNRELSYED